MYTDAGKTAPAGDADSVYVWGDLSGNGRDYIQSTLANRPVYGAATKGLNFNGTTTLMTSTWAATTNAFTAFFVLDPDSAAAGWLIGGAGTGVIGHSGSSFAAHDGAALRQPIVGTTSAQLVAATFTGGVMTAWRDGKKLGTASYDNTWSWSNPALGSVSASYYDGLIKFVMIVPSALSDGNMQTVSAAIMSAFRLSFNWRTSVAGLAMQLEATAGVTKNGSNQVTRWTCQKSSTNFDIVTANEYCKYSASVTGLKKAAISFTAGATVADEVMKATTGAALGGWNNSTTFFALKDGSGAGSPHLMRGGASATAILYLSDAAATPAGNRSVYDGTARRSGQAPIAGAQVLGFRLDTSGTPSVKFYDDGVEAASTAYDSTFDMDAAATVVLGNNTSASGDLTADISAIAKYSRALTALEVTAVSESMDSEFIS